MTTAFQVFVAVALAVLLSRQGDRHARRPVIRAAIRRAIRGATCTYCDAPAVALDHVRPISRGGTDDPENLVPACLGCNSAKGARLLDEWDAARVLRGVARSPKVYAEVVQLERLRRNVRPAGRRAFRIVAQDRASALPPAAVAPDPHFTPDGERAFTLAEAAREPWCVLDYATLRQRKSRAGAAWPSPAVVFGARERWTEPQLRAALGLVDGEPASHDTAHVAGHDTAHVMGAGIRYGP